MRDTIPALQDRSRKSHIQSGERKRQGPATLQRLQTHKGFTVGLGVSGTRRRAGHGDLCRISLNKTDKNPYSGVN